MIVAKAWTYNCWVRGISVVTSPLNENMQVRNNIIKVETMSDDVDMNTQRYPVTCVGVFGSDEFFDTPEIVFTDNVFRTNAAFVTFGYEGGGSGAVFYRNTFEKINHHDSQFWPFRMKSITDLLNNKIIDSLAGPGVDLSLPPLNWTYWVEPRFNLAIGVSSNRVYEDAASGAPLANRNIAWVTDGGNEGNFTTDSQGKVNGPFQYIKTEYGMPEYGFNDTGLKPSTTYYYRIRLVKDGYAGLFSDTISFTAQ